MSSAAIVLLAFPCSVCITALVVYCCCRRHRLVVHRDPIVVTVAIDSPRPVIEVADEEECAICLTRQPAWQLLPCKHSLCILCAVRVELCPFCRSEIHGRMLRAIQ